MLDIIILILTILSSCIILYFSFRNKHKPGASSLIVFALEMTTAAFANYFIYRTPIQYISIWFAVILLAVRISFTSILTFVIQFTRHEDWLKPSSYLLLAIEPVLTQILFWTNPGNKFFSTELNLGSTNALALENPWFLVSTIYTNALLLMAFFLLARDFNFRPMAYRFQTRFVLAGISASILINNSFSTSIFLTIQELKIISLIATGLAIIAGFVHSGFYQIFPIARERVVEYMSDGWIILDKRNYIVDLNPAAENIIGLSAKELTGQPAEKMAITWPNLMNSLNDTRPLDLKGSVKIEDVWAYLNIYILPLYDNRSNYFGKLITLRDITERRVADEARQQARDEMFILLHSITSAAGRAINLDDFLSESIYQIVYSSHSQSISVYLLEERGHETPERYLVLAAQHGGPAIPESKTSSLSEFPEIVTWVLDHREPLLIPDIQSDARIPAQMLSLGHISLLLIPMMMEGEVLGIIILTRTESPTYNEDEIARLTAVTDEVATFVQSNRQRQLSIALAERQRLVHDLHDSVTQKLYGLVTLAEATQAGIQAGVTDMPAKVIGRMADNARQALKEMRLFLFQMQPVDFERDGLASVLQQRLSAVEGRADINARLIFDEKFSLPMEKELALYFIAQEALNNVIKHAKAKNVKISLQNRNANYTLVVEDDGCGFDPKNIDSGGLGMRSMRERAMQIGGKLKISSALGKGTKIAVSLRNIDWSGEK